MPGGGGRKWARAGNGGAALAGLGSIQMSRSWVKRGWVYSIPASPPTTRYLAPKPFNALNRSLKCEFGLTLLLPSLSFHYHLPRSGEDRGGTLSLPELDVEFAIALANLAESLHDPRRGIVLALAHHGYNGTTEKRRCIPSGIHGLSRPSVESHPLLN